MQVWEFIKLNFYHLISEGPVRFVHKTNWSLKWEHLISRYEKIGHINTMLNPIYITSMCYLHNDALSPRSLINIKFEWIYQGDGHTSFGKLNLKARMHNIKELDPV